MNHFRALLNFFSVISCFSASIADLQDEAIIDGDDADYDQFKYQIAVLNNGEVECGGVIIADNYVLTAAHCFIDFVFGKNGTFGFGIPDSPYEVVAGAEDLNNKTQKSVTVKVDKIYLPKTFIRKGLLSDIVVLKLKENLGLGKNPHIIKAQLPQNNETYSGKIATVSGYGYSSIETMNLSGVILEHGGFTDLKLKYAPVKIIDNDECKKKLNASSVKETFNPPVESSNICGHVIDRNEKPRGVCSGDSGGPLVFDNTVIGIVSVSPPGCTEHELPARYTRVSYFVPFIRDVMNGNTINAYVHTVGEFQEPLWPFEIPNKDNSKEDNSDQVDN